MKFCHTTPMYHFLRENKGKHKINFVQIGIRQADAEENEFCQQIRFLLHPLVLFRFEQNLFYAFLYSHVKNDTWVLCDKISFSHILVWHLCEHQNELLLDF